MSFTRMVLDHEVTAAQQIDQMGIGASDRFKDAQGLANYFGQLASGTRSHANISINVGAALATGAVTFTGLPTATETVTIGNVVFTARASGASGNEFNIGATAALTAANLATSINASASLSGIVTASAASGVVTLTAVVPGTLGNAIQLSESLSNATVTQFTGGTNGTAFTISLL